MIPHRIAAAVKPLVPSGLFSRLKSIHKKWQQRRLEPLSEDIFRSILTDRLSLSKGRVVFIHSALDGMKLDFSPFRVLPILKEIVGPDGTLLFPTTHFVERAEVYLRSQHTFHVKSSPSVYGFLTEMARRDKDAHRSWHPTNSVVAIGKHAEELIREHHLDVYPCGPKSPYFRITEYDGLIIGLGVSPEYLSFVHVVEDVYPDLFPVQTRLDETINAEVVDPTGNGHIVKTLAAHPNIKYRNIPKYAKRYIPADILEMFDIYGSPFYRANSVPLLNRMKTLAEQEITIYSEKVLRK